MRPDELLVVCQPFRPETVPTEGGRLYRDGGPLSWVDTRSEGGDVEVVHPAGNRLTLPFWVVEDDLLVWHADHWNAFEDPETMLWFPSPEPPEAAADLLALTWSTGSGERIAYFRRIAGLNGPESRGDVELAGKIGRSPAGRDSLIARRLYRLCSRPWERAARRNLNVRKVEEEPEGAFGWTNPVILAVDLRGESLAKADAQGEPWQGGGSSEWRRLSGRDSTLKALVGRPEARLAVSSLFGDDPRLYLRWRYLADLAEAWVGGPRTAVETLLLGIVGTDRPTWRAPLPFLLLDELGGSFLLDTPLDFGREPPSWHWLPPERLSGNIRWLAERMVEEWGGKLGSVESAANSRSAWPGPPAPRWLATRTFLVADEGKAELTTSSAAVLRFVAGGKPGLFAVLAELFEDPRVRETEPYRGCHRGHLRVGEFPVPAGSVRLELDEGALLEAIGWRFLAPRSPVLVRFPDAGDLPESADEGLCREHGRTFSGRFLDLVRTPRRGSARFLTELHARTRNAATSEGSLVYEWGWWDRWLQALYRRDFRTPWRIELPSGGFVIGTDALAYAALGRGERLTKVPREVRL